jgi:hypothetical protein
MGKKLVYFEDRPQDFRNAMLVGGINLRRKLSADRSQCFWHGQLFYVVTSVIVRLSITVTLLRLTVDILHRSILCAATVLSVVAGTIFFFFSIFQCTPVNFYWNQMTQEGHCMDIDTRLGIVYMYSAAAAVCDFTIGLLPVFMIGKLKMERHTKMAVIGILSIGCLYVLHLVEQSNLTKLTLPASASTAVIVRIPFLSLSKSREFLCRRPFLAIDRPKLTFTDQTTQVSIWSNIETGLGITAGSLMTVRPFLRAIGFLKLD